MNFSLEGLAADYRTARKNNTELVLATIIETQGSTYRKAGARMLITRDHCCIGVLGGTELHQAILAGAESVFASHGMQIQDLDAGQTATAALDQELEAGARITVLLEYLAAGDLFNSMELIIEGLQRKEAVLATVCDSSIEDCLPGSGVLLTADTIIKGNLLDRHCQAMADIAGQIQQTGQPSLESCISGEGSFTAFFDLIMAPVHLLIIGAGPDALPVVRLARAMDWSVTVADSRASCTSSEPPLPADRILTLEPEALPSQVTLDQIDAAVIMTHRLDLDERFLRCLHGTGPKYIGLLGTQRRRDKLLQALGPDADDTGIYGPVGLDLGGRSPEQIALSIVSEIQAVLNHRAGGRLSASATGTNTAPVASDQDLYAVVLAAGGSRRYGGIKQLLEMDGRSMLKRTIDIAGATLEDRVKLVLGLKPNKLQREADGYDLEIIVNKEWANGIASSLRAGMKSLPGHCQGALILLCDQPLINESHLSLLIDAWRQQPEKIIASAYADTMGVPAIFPQKYFSSILELQGDRGAKSVIDKYRDAVVPVPIPEAEVDIDTQEDLIKILNRK